MEKQYDWFATRIFQPEMSIDELFDQGITPENTGFKTRDEYKNIESVRDQFRNSEGLFDEDAFNRAYNSSREMFNLYTNREYSKKLLEEYAYDPYEWYSPATSEIADITASNTPTKNGMLYSTNIAGIGEDTESPYSIREIAQKQLVHDENGNELDWTPEDHGGLLKGLYRDPLVLATYDEDTPEYDEAGNLIAVHKKGDYKYNEWGAPYYEKLGDRDAYGKQMLHYSDTLTREGTVLNKFDFYDSDGKRKSVFGTAMKTVAQIAPMFLPPAIGYTWGAINAAKGIGQSLAALSKGIDSIITGSDDNEFGRTMTKMENWLARFDDSKSDYGQTHMWSSAETYGDLIGSTTKQLFEQRIIGKIPQQLKFLGTDIQRSKMGQNMAIAYMAATSAKESYQAGIEAGLGDRQAGLLLLANTAAMWKLMDSDYGRSTLFKGSWFDDDIAKKTAKETAEQMVKSTDDRFLMEEINDKMAKYGSTKMVLAKGSKGTKAVGNAIKDKVDDAVQSGTKAAGKTAGKNAATQTAIEEAKTVTEEKGVSMMTSARKFVKEAYDKFSTNLKNKLELFVGAVEPGEYLAAMRNEAIEEVVEEAISDATKAVTLGLEALGFKMNETGEKLDFGFSGKDIFDRYLLSFIGGGVGGGIFRGYSAFERVRDNGWKRVIPDYQKDLIFMVAEGRGDELIQEYKRLHKKGLLGSDNLKSNFKMSVNESAEVAADGEMTQADAILKVLTGNVRFIEQVLNDEGLFDAIRQSKEGDVVSTRNAIWSKDNDHLTEQQKRGMFLMSRMLGAHQLMTHDFIKLGEDFVTAKLWKQEAIDKLDGKTSLTEQEKESLEAAKSDYAKRIKELRERRDAILDGKYNAEYVSSILLETEGVLPKLLNVGKLGKDRWAMSMYGCTYDSLTPLYQKQVDKDMEIYFKKGYNFYGRHFAETHDGTKRAFQFLQRLMKPEFERQNDNLKSKKLEDIHSDNYFGEEYFRVIDEAAKLEKGILELETAKQSLVKANDPKNQAKIAQIDTKLQELNLKYAEIEKRYAQYSFVNNDPNVEHEANFVPTSMLLRRFKGDNAKMQQLVDTYHKAIQAKDGEINEVFPNLFEQILSIYNDIKTDNGIVQDLGELKMAEQALIAFIDHVKNGGLNLDPTLGSLWTEIGPPNTLLGPSSSNTKSEFLEALNELQEALKSSSADKYRVASSAYDKMQALVIQTTNEVKKDSFYDAYLDSDQVDPNNPEPHANFVKYVERAFYFPGLNISDNLDNYKNPFETFFNILKTVEQLKPTPLSQILSVFGTKTDSPDIVTAADYVESFFNKYASTRNWRDFLIANGNDQTLLESLIEVLDTLEIMVSMDNKTIDMINAFADKDNQFMVFDPIAKRNLLRSIDALRNKIYTVWRNGKMNSGNRHAEIEKDFKRRTLNEVQNLLKFWGDIEDDDLKNTIDIRQIWEDIISSSKYKDDLKDFENLNVNTLSGDKFTDIYALIKNFEAKIFAKWKDVTENLSSEESAKLFLGLFEKAGDAYTEILLGKTQNPYDRRDTGSVTPTETFMYLLQMFSVDCANLDGAYKRVLSKFEPSTTGVPRIPNDEQERAVKMAAAYLSKPSFWTAVRTELMSRINNFNWDENTVNGKIANNIKYHTILNNTLIIPGACGVGKTTMVGAVLQELWTGTRPTIFTAPKKETAENLAKSFGDSDQYTVVAESDGCAGKTALFKFLFGDNATNEFELVEENGVLKIKDINNYSFLISDSQLDKLKDYEVLIVDEIGQYNEVELKYIDEIAAKAGIVVIGLGDHCQMGDVVTYTHTSGSTGTANSNYQDVEVWKTPYLVRSMRNTSIAKGTNNERLGRNMYTIESIRHETDGDISKQIIAGKVGDIDITTNLIYSGHLTEGFRGDKIVKTKESFDKTVDHIFNTKLDEDTVSIVVDTDEKKQQWITKLKQLNIDPDGKIRDITKNEINGYETTYTIVDVNWDQRVNGKGNSAKGAWKDFYTISQRSHNATLFLDETETLKKIHITSEYHADAAKMWSNELGFAQKWYQNRTGWITHNGDNLWVSENPFKINHSGGGDDDNNNGNGNGNGNGSNGSNGGGTVPVPGVTQVGGTTANPSGNTQGQSAAGVLGGMNSRTAQRLQQQQDQMKQTVKDCFSFFTSNGFVLDTNGNVTYSKIADLDSKTSDQLRDILTEIVNVSVFGEHVRDSINSAQPEVARAVDDQITTLTAYMDFFDQAKNAVQVKLNSFNSLADSETNATLVKNVLDGIVADDTTKSLTQRIQNAETTLTQIATVEPYVSGLLEDAVLNIFGFNKAELEQKVAQLKQDTNNLKTSLEGQRASLILAFESTNPDKLTTDTFDNLDLNALPTDIVSQIDTVIAEYQNKVSTLVNNEDTQSNIDAKRNVWNQRIQDLTDLRNALNTPSGNTSGTGSSGGNQTVSGNLQKAITQEETIIEELKNYNAATADERLRRKVNIGALIRNLIDFCNNALKSTLPPPTPEEEVELQKMRDKWKTYLDQNPVFTIQPGVTSFDTGTEYQGVRGFNTNQQTSADAALNLDETQQALEQSDTDVQIEKKFTSVGFAVYQDLLAKTDKKSVEVWGLDLETTSIYDENGKRIDPEIAQVGLVKYRISRNGENWSVEEVPGTRISQFVSPTTAGLEPPEIIKNEENPIYNAWKSDSHKISEDKALDLILSKIGKDDYVVTYNGKDFDMDVIRKRAIALNKNASLVDGWLQVDVYEDFITRRWDVSGDLLWSSKTGEKKTIGGLGTYTGDRTLSNVVRQIDTQLVRYDETTGIFYDKNNAEIEAHDAAADVAFTLDILINMFNGIPLFRNEQRLVRDGNVSETLSDDIYWRSLLLPYVEKIQNSFTASKEKIFESCSSIRHKILQGTISVDKTWTYDAATDQSTLICSYGKFKDLPLIRVKGKRSGEFKGTFKYNKARFTKNATDDIDLVELKKRCPNLRFSKPFVLTGLKYNENIGLENLSEGALKFYTPGKTGGNLGKTFVLVTEDPNFSDGWDPALALTGTRRDNGQVDWRDLGFEMLTVSRTANLQEMINFSTASCTFAADKIGGFMEDYFNPMRENRPGPIPTQIVAGITLSSSHYEALLNTNMEYVDRLKMFNSEVFSVMDSGKVGEFLASFLNGCLENPDAGSLLDIGTGKPLSTPLEEWIFNNLAESLTRVHYNTGFSKDTVYSKYYFLDLQIGGQAFKLVYNKGGAGEGYYLFLDEPNLNFDEKIASVAEKQPDNTIVLRTLTDKKSIQKGIYLGTGGINVYQKISDVAGIHFDGSSLKDLSFNKVALTMTYRNKKSEVKTYPVSTNEVFTRAFTSWNGNGDVAGLNGWDRVFEHIKRDMKGFQHDIFGHEIIDKGASSWSGSTIFTPSICTNSLNGEYKARTTKLTQYGSWTIVESVDKIAEFKDKLNERVNKIGKLSSSTFATFIKSHIDIDALSQNESNLNMSDDLLDAWFINEVNKLSVEFHESDVKLESFAILDGEYTVTAKFKDVDYISNDYNKDYYWVNGSGTERAYLTFDSNGKPESFYLQKIDENDPREVSLIPTTEDMQNAEKLLNILLLRNLLVTLWDKDFNLDDRTQAGYVRFFVAQFNTVALDPTLKRKITNGILNLDKTIRDVIFTQEIKDLLLAENVTLNALYEISGDFYTALEDSFFDVLELIEKIC